MVFLWGKCGQANVRFGENLNFIDGLLRVESGQNPAAYNNSLSETPNLRFRRL
jgi:hypothetical protein